MFADKRNLSQPVFLPEPGTGREGPTGTDALIRAIYAGYKKIIKLQGIQAAAFS